MDFAALKQASQGQDSMEAINKMAEEKANKNRTTDERFWKHSYDEKTKVGTSLIRFLPCLNPERLPWSEWIEYNFKGSNGFYNERSRRDLGEDDPVSELNSVQYNRNHPGDQDAAKARKRSFKYVYCIVVLDDPVHPENNGKVKLFKVGPAIYKMVEKARKPAYADIKPINPFDLWNGANFRIRTRKKDANSDWVNYDDSAFETPGPLDTRDAVIEKVVNEIIPLDEFDSEDNYKSYEKLTEKMVKVLGAPYVAGILGQAPSGTGQETPAEETATANDPFAGVAGSAPTQTTNDPFAGVAQNETTATSDPFAGVGTSEPKDEVATTNDPFANMDLTV